MPKNLTTGVSDQKTFIFALMICNCVIVLEGTDKLLQCLVVYFGHIQFYFFILFSIYCWSYGSSIKKRSEAHVSLHLKLLFLKAYLLKTALDSCNNIKYWRERQKEWERQRGRGGRKATLPCLSLSEGLTGREIDHWSMTAQYDPTLSCSMLSVEWAPWCKS